MSKTNVNEEASGETGILKIEGRKEMMSREARGGDEVEYRTQMGALSEGRKGAHQPFVHHKAHHPGLSLGPCGFYTAQQ